MDQSIGARVAASIPQGVTHKHLAERVGMTPDAFSRAVHGTRAFSAVELANLSEELSVDVHFLITGEPDPNRLRVAARHSFDQETKTRFIAAAETDMELLADIAFAYRQGTAGAIPPSTVPGTLDEVRELLGYGFVRKFVDRLEAVGIDVVRVPQLGTSYSMYVGPRAVIALKATGNWFHENWSLAHELFHLGTGDLEMVPSHRRESEANAFAADLLMPAADLRAREWHSTTAADLALVVWELGVSTEALATRLRKLRIDAPEWLFELLMLRTQGLLRRHLRLSELGDPITARMDAASRRHFPTWLQDAHLAGIASGRIQKDTLAWILDVDASDLDVDEPVQPEPPTGAELRNLFG